MAIPSFLLSFFSGFSANPLWLNIYYLLAGVAFGMMAPGILEILRRDLAKIMGNTDLYAQLSEITKKNADNFAAQLRMVVDAPRFLCNKVNSLHNFTFPSGIAQVGAIGRQITPPKKSKPGTGNRQSRQARRPAKASSSGSPSAADDEPPRQLLDNNRLLTETALAAYLCISKKSLQNQYSKAPWTLPSAVQIPGAKGPRWTAQSVQKWLEICPKHSTKSAPTAGKRNVGRPRIAGSLGLVVGGAK